MPLTQTPCRVDNLPSVRHVDQVEQIDIPMTEALHARNPYAQVVDPDLDPPVEGIFAPMCSVRLSVPALQVRTLRG